MGGESWASNTESSSPGLGSGTGAQMSQEIECWGQAVMKSPSEVVWRHPEKVGRGLWGAKFTALIVVPCCRPG